MIDTLFKKIPYLNTYFTKREDQGHLSFLVKLNIDMDLMEKLFDFKELENQGVEIISDDRNSDSIIIATKELVNMDSEKFNEIVITCANAVLDYHEKRKLFTEYSNRLQEIINSSTVEDLKNLKITVNGAKVEKRTYNKRKNVGESTMNVETPQILDEDAPVTPTETSNTDDTDNIQTENENPNY